MGYAFISYSSTQQRQLDQVKEYLKTNNISFWSAPEDIPIGSKYSEVITRAITNASCVLFLLSDRSQNSTYCKLEIALALKLEKPIIPIQLEDVILNDDFALYLSSSEFFPLPKKITTAKTNKLLNQLRLLCADPEQGPVEPVDPSYKIGWFRKGTWMQIFGWIWVVGGFKLFSAFADLCFPVPSTDGGGNHPIDYFNGALVLKMGFKSGLLITGLMLIGLLTLCYGFSLNRKIRGKTRLFFKQFSLCQLLFLISCVCWGIGFNPSIVGIEGYHTSLTDFGYTLTSISLNLFPIILIVWLIQKILQLYRTHKRKKKQPIPSEPNQ